MNRVSDSAGSGSHRFRLPVPGSVLVFPVPCSSFFLLSFDSSHGFRMLFAWLSHGKLVTCARLLFKQCFSMSFLVLSLRFPALCSLFFLYLFILFSFFSSLFSLLSSLFFSLFPFFFSLLLSSSSLFFSLMSS